MSEFAKNAHAGIKRVLMEMESVDVVCLLATHISTDPKLQQLIVCHWMQSICAGTDQSVQKELQLRFSSLLTEKIDLEVVATSHNSTEAVLYLFGAELDSFGVPVSLFRVNYIAFACISRLLADGRDNTSKLSFRSYTCSSTNTKSKWWHFSYNATFQLHFQRSAIVCSIMAYFAATSHRANLVSATYHSSNYRSIMRVLLMSALSDSLSQIFGSGRSFSWLSGTQLYRLLFLCKADDTFTAKAFLVELASLYQELFKQTDEQAPAEPRLVEVTLSN